MASKKLVLITSALMILNSCYLSTVNKEFIVEDDERVPLENAKIYMLCKTYPYLFYVDKWFSDMKTGKTFSTVSDANGKVKIESKLYFPGSFDLFVILPGYHPTLLPLKTDDTRITLLSEKRFRTESIRKENDKRFSDLVFRKGSQVLPGIKYSDMFRIYSRDRWERPSVYGNDSKYIGESKDEASRNNQMNIYNSRKYDSGVFIQEN